MTSIKYDSAVYDEEFNTWKLERGGITDASFPDQKLLASGFALVPEQLPASVIGARRFRERLLLVRDNEAFGYADLRGSWVIAPQFGKAKPFYGGKAAVCPNGQWGHIHKP